MGIFFDNKEEKLRKQQEHEKRNSAKTRHYSWDTFTQGYVIPKILYKNDSVQRYFVFENNEEFENFKKELKILHDNLFNFIFQNIENLSRDETSRLGKDLEKLKHFLFTKSYETINFDKSDLKKFNAYYQHFCIYEPRPHDIGYLKIDLNAVYYSFCFFVKLGKNESSKHTPKEREEIIKHIKDKFFEEEQREKYEEEQREYEYFCRKNNLNPTYPLSMHKFLNQKT